MDDLERQDSPRNERPVRVFSQSEIPWVSLSAASLHSPPFSPCRQVRAAPVWWASRCRGTASSGTPSTPPPGWSPTDFVSLYDLHFLILMLFDRIITFVLKLAVAALKIHVSPTTREVLELFNCFELEYRGEMEMKVIYLT